MAELFIESDEWYPVWSVTEVRRNERQRTFEIDRATLDRWRAAREAFLVAQLEMHDLVDPPCPDCGHRTSRHQEWSAQWNYWGCLASGCRCQHGIPEERKEQVDG